jgi:DNA-binding response OmpR family regulator
MSLPPDQKPANEPGPSTIFVVEPEILVRMVIAAYLRGCGFTVIEGVAAEDVVAVLDAGRQIDIIFADAKLPGDLDGFGLAHWVRKHHPGVDMLLTSSVAKSAQMAGELCEDGPMDKPYHPQEVLRRIHILLERKRTTK